MKKRYHRDKKHFIRYILAALLIGVGIFIIGKNLIHKQQVDQSNAHVKKAAKLTIETGAKEEEIVDPNLAKVVDFNALWAINSDIYAYIEIPDTAISYPVLQSSTQEEDYYLETTVEGISGLPGSIYVQQINGKEFEDPNTILYGHDMLDGSMFAGLHNYADRSFFDSHPYVYIYLPDKTLKYQVFAAVVFSDAYLPDHYNVKDQGGTNAFVQAVLQTQDDSNQYLETFSVTGQERVLTLSTCIGDRPENRWLVVGTLVDEKEK